MATVTFQPRNDGGIPEPTLSEVRRLIELVLRDTRRPEEIWVIRHHEPHNGHDWELTVTSGDKTETLLLQREDADANEAFYGVFRHFVRQNWP